jgi:hypothetical protein
LVVPGQSPEIPIFKDLLSARGVADLNARAAAYFLDVSAPTDARPFFFNQLRLFSLEDVQRMIGEIRTAKGPFSESGVVITGNLLAFGTLFIIIVLSLIVVLFTIVLPARSSIFAVDRRLALLGSCYFLLIGLGFMFVEIGLIQRISTLLGHPVYAMSIGLFSIILSTGLGSLLSESIVLTRRNHFLLWLGLLGAYLVLLPTWLPQLTGSALQASGLLQRAVASVAVILPAGLLMGFGFPCGMRLVMARDPRPTPWFWGVNGAAGVLAAGLAVVSSISFSIDTTIRTGGVLYLLLAPVALMLLGIKLDPSRKAT